MKLFPSTDPRKDASKWFSFSYFLIEGQLLYRIGFCQISTWISHRYTYLRHRHSFFKVIVLTAEGNIHLRVYHLKKNYKRAMLKGQGFRSTSFQFSTGKSISFRYQPISQKTLTVILFFRKLMSFFSLFICSELCHTLKWNSHGFTCVPHPDPN